MDEEMRLLKRSMITLALVGVALLPAAGSAAAKKQPKLYSYDVPVQASSPWPEMRRDSRNTGASPIRARYRGQRPWSFRTGRGIFSTPVIGGDGTIYVGSADGNFYALGPGGHPRWRFPTGGIIDAAAAIGRYDPALKTSPITIGSGDEVLYQLRTKGHLPPRRRVIWRFAPSLPPVTGQLVNWWEGNVAIGPDGALYAGNTGGGAYALNPDGSQRWVATRANSVWTTPAFGHGAQAGNTFWGSVDLFAFSLDHNGQQRWQTFTPGYVTSSPALGSDGTVYVGSFGNNVYALDPENGDVIWQFPTSDHIYSSPALAADSAGRTTAVYIGSADGSVYALDTSGHLLWRYDTGDPVRSSPVLGRAPRGGGQILYVGSSNGKLYALDAATGARRWSFDTTPPSGPLRDRNDLNGSPALGPRGVYIGGEHGRVWFVPYDYCLHNRDQRCDRRPGQDLGADLNRMYLVTPGGSTVAGRAPKVPPATVIATRLIVRRSGRTEDAALQPAAPAQLVSSKPAFSFTTELSGDGHFLFIRPETPLQPGTRYRLRVHGDWRIGSTASGESGAVDTTLAFRTRASRGTLPLRARGSRVGAFSISRLAIPLPPLLPSVNQIGFDSYDMISGAIARSSPNGGPAGKLLLWVIGARRDRRGNLHPDPAGNFQFPLSGSYGHDTIDLSSHGLSLQFSFGPVPLREFTLRGQLGSGLVARPGTGLYAEAKCGDVPNYASQLRVAGVCNELDTLAASGALLTHRYSGGTANRRPKGVGLGALQLTRPGPSTPGSAVATLALGRGARFPAASHVGSILLTAPGGDPIALDYRRQTTVTASPRGDIQSIHLTIPTGTSLPPIVRAYAIADVFPLGHRDLG